MLYEKGREESECGLCLDAVGINGWLPKEMRVVVLFVDSLGEEKR